MAYKYLSLKKIDKWVPVMRVLGVSVVARSRSGFLAAYRRAGGKPARLSEYWRNRRDNFIKRHMAQVKLNREPLFEDGFPTRRHLALVAWAYSPAAGRI